MKITNTGDLVQATMLRRDTARIKDDLNRLTGEMASGKVASLNNALRGQFGPLAGITRDLALNDITLTSNATVGRIAAGQQLALEMMQDVALEAGPGFLDGVEKGNSIQVAVLARNATGQFEQTIAALNTRIENKSVFAGAAIDGPALADAETILSELEIAIDGAASPADVLSIALDWFDSPGGGFEHVAYQGASVPMSDNLIAPGETARLDITAADPAFRSTLRGLALGALLGRGLFDGDQTAQKQVMKQAGEALISAADTMTVLRAGLGFTEQRIETARLRTESETTGLKLARAALVESDPYDTAVKLKEVQVQLETIYTLTARLSNLSLALVLR